MLKTTRLNVLYVAFMLSCVFTLNLMCPTISELREIHKFTQGNIVVRKEVSDFDFN